MYTPVNPRFTMSVCSYGVIFHYVSMSMNTCIHICNIWCFLRLQKRRFKVQFFMFSVNIGTYFALTTDCGYSLEAPEYSSIQSIFVYLPKVLVIPRKRWLRPDTTEKLFTGTLSLNKTKTKINLISWPSKAQNIQNLENIW